ncbi:hypothetical protein HUJ05_012399 [Dendroctonus ponderosae]|nr:hypothetical protein HUJ05_012399 [Dendroctonus ponderosae]
MLKPISRWNFALPAIFRLGKREEDRKCSLSIFASGSQYVTSGARAANQKPQRAPAGAESQSEGTRRSPRALHARDDIR